MKIFLLNDFDLLTLGWYKTFKTIGIMARNKMAENNVTNDDSEKYDIFISWSNDKDGVGKELADLFEDFLVDRTHLKVFSSHKIASGDWAKKVNIAFKDCKFAVFLLTTKAADSSWVNFELGALHVSISEYNVNDENIFVFYFPKKFELSKSVFKDIRYTIVDFNEENIEKLFTQINNCFGLGLDIRRHIFGGKHPAWERFNDDVNDVLSKQYNYISNAVLREKYSTLEDEKCKEIAKIRTEKDEIINKLQEEIKNQEEEIKTYKTSEKGKLQQEISKLKSQIAEYSVSYHTLESDKAQLLAQLRSKEDEIELLKKQNEEDDLTKDLPIQLPDGTRFIMKQVKGGTFQMGSSNDSDYEKPVHNVSLSSYYIGETQVTQGLWKAVMGNNPSYFQKGDNYPVENVSYNMIVKEFIPKLNQKTGRYFRLPTEAEWEYAAGWRKGGGCNKFSGCQNEIGLKKYAWYDENSNNTTHEVATRLPNDLGIYDMSGNVWEWCQDWYASDYYGNSPSVNPPGPASGSGRVLRGGSWYDDADYCRISYRNFYAPAIRNYGYGFRLLLSSPKKEKI